MSFLNFNLNDVPDKKILEEREYKVRCLGAEIRDSKDPDKVAVGAQNLVLRLDVPEEPNADDIYFYIPLPNSGDDPKAVNDKLRKLRTAAQAFNVAFTDGIDTTGFIGQSAWAHIVITPEQGQYPARNDIRKFVAAA